MSDIKMQIPVDATVLQYQNQQLVQQLEAQKIELHNLEGNIKELRNGQKLYDNTLIAINKMWNQLVNDLVLLGLRAGGDLRYLQTLEYRDLSTEVLASCPPEDIILCRLLRTESIEKKDENSTVKFVQEALASRHAATLQVMTYLQEIIATRRAKNECIKLALHGNLSVEDAKVEFQKFHESLGEVESNMHETVKILNEKQQLYEEGIKKYLESNSREQAEIKRLSGELEDSMAELEESRRKLAILQMQKHGASGLPASTPSLANGSNSPDKSADKIGLKNLKDSIEEAKAMAANRLLELQEAQEDTLILSKKLEDLQSQLKDDKYLVASKPYILSSDKLQHMNAELSRYKGLIEILQADRSSYMAREKELSTKADAADATNNLISDNELKIEELESQVSKTIAEHNDLELKCEEAQQDLGRKDIKDEIRVMASALSKEMEMMQAQVNRSKEAAAEVISLCEEADSLRTLLKNKASDHKVLADKYAKQLVEIKSLKEMIENLEKERQELETFLDMHGQECFDTRTILEIKESEHKAQVQAELLKTTLEEHSLELRVKAANDAEATCQQRLSVAEAGLPELRAKLDAAERDVLELREAIRIKDAEAEAYISEIETIGQAYEDMQTQNQHLLQQVADRDDYNIKLVSDSVKMKQTHTSFISEKQSVMKQLQQVSGSLELFKSKVAHGEEQVKVHITQAVNASIENRSININLEKTKLELADSEKELKWLRSVVSSSEKEYEQNQKRIDELRIELERERNERKRLEEELEEVKAEVLEMSPESEEATIHKLQEEIKECKAILKCGVCFDRPKEVVITKCFHLFCNLCIQRNLEIRHRKCPGCGTPFGQNDVRKVNI